MNIQTNEAGFGGVAVIGVLAVLILGGGAYLMSSGGKKSEDMTKNDVSQETSEVTEDKMTDDVSHETDSMADAGGTMMKDDPRLETITDEELAADGAPVQELPNTPEMDKMDDMASGEATTDEPEMADPLPLASGTFQEYSAEKLALAETGDVVLFFHASWCPSCRGLESDINSNLSQIPDGVHILQVDYDSATDLKKKYGVVRQHTLVQVNESGDAVKTLTGLTNTLDQVVAQI